MNFQNGNRYEHQITNIQFMKINGIIDSRKEIEELKAKKNQTMNFWTEIKSDFSSTEKVIPDIKDVYWNSWQTLNILLSSETLELTPLNKEECWREITDSYSQTIACCLLAIWRWRINRKTSFLTHAQNKAK